MRVDYILPDGEIKETFELADGLTLRQAACTLFPDTEGKFPAPVIAIVGDRPAVRELGDWDYPLSGAGRIQFRQIALGGGGGGGGSNPLEVIFKVVVAIVGIIASYFCPPLGALILMGGGLLAGLLFQQDAGGGSLPSGHRMAHDNEAASPTYNINASGNQARLYQPEPHLFGRMKIKPDFVANVWTKYIGNDQFGYFVYGLTAGECEVEAMQFGDTVFWKDGHFVEDTGYVTDLKAQVVGEPNLTLGASDWSAPISATIEGTEFRTIDLQITFPNGLASYKYQKATSTQVWHAPYYDDYGDWHAGYYETVSTPAKWVVQNHTARLAVQLRRLTGEGQPDGDWVDQGTFEWTAKVEKKLVKTATLKPGFGTWQVRVRNESDLKDDGRAREKMVLTKVSGTAASMTIQFLKPGEFVKIFPDNIHTSQEVSGQELYGPNDAEYAGVTGPYAANPAGTEAIRLHLDFALPQGLYSINDEGGIVSRTVKWKIELQRIDDYGNELGQWETLENLKMTKATRTPQRRTYSYDVPQGRYRVRCRRTTNKGGTRDMDTLTWQALRAELPGTYTYPISCVAISVKANNTLSQKASQEFSVIATRKLPLYDRASKTWGEPVATRSWAAAVSHVCKSEWGGRLSDRNIDLDALWAIDEQLQAKGWNYDSYIDNAYLVWTLLSEMCQSQCVIPRLVGPVLSFAMDAWDRPPTFALTPRNIMRGTFQVNYITWGDDTPDDVVLDYLDAEAGFAQRDVTATLPESESLEPTSLSILGITDRTHAFRVATRYAAHNRWSRIRVECQVEMLGRIVNRGDVCSVSHPRFKNTASGVVKSWDALALAITIERDMPRDVPDGWDASGAGLYVAFAKNDGSIWGPCKMVGLAGGVLTLDSGDYSTLLLQGAGSPFDWMVGENSNRQPTSYVIYESREYQRLMVVESVTSQDLQHYALKLANYDARIYQYEDLPVPIWQGRGQIAISDALNAPANLGGIIESTTRVRLVWAMVPGATGYEVELAVSGGDWEAAASVTGTEYTAIVPAGMTYARVRALSDDKVSEWSLWQGDTSMPLPSRPSLSATDYTGGEARVTWNAVANAASYTVTLSHGDDELYVARTAGTSFAVTAEMQTGGPFREVSVSVAAENSTGVSGTASVTLKDALPPAVTGADVSIFQNGAAFDLTLRAITPAPPSDATGYLIAKGETADFGVRQLSELRQAVGLPFTWAGLAQGRHYFRVAIRDAFYEIARDPLTLNWSAVLVADAEPVSGTDEEAEEGGNG